MRPLSGAAVPKVAFGDPFVALEQFIFAKSGIKSTSRGSLNSEAPFRLVWGGERCPAFSRAQEENMTKFWHWAVIVVVIFACIYVSNNYTPVSNIVG